MQRFERRLLTRVPGDLTNLISLSPSIVLVDDDPVYGKMFQRAAEIKGVSCTYCQSPREFYRQLGSGFDIALLDYELGQVTGLQLSRILKLIAPKKFVILTSAYRSIRYVEEEEDFLKGFINKTSPALSQVEEVLKIWDRKKGASRHFPPWENAPKYR